MAMIPPCRFFDAADMRERSCFLYCDDSLSPPGIGPCPATAIVGRSILYEPQHFCLTGAPAAEPFGDWQPDQLPASQWPSCARPHPSAALGPYADVPAVFEERTVQYGPLLQLTRPRSQDTRRGSNCVAAAGKLVRRAGARNGSFPVQSRSIASSPQFSTEVVHTVIHSR